MRGSPRYAFGMVAKMQRAFSRVAAQSRSVTALVLGLATSAVSLVACGGDSPPDTSGTTGARAGTGATASAGAPTGVGGTSGASGREGGGAGTGGASSLGGAGSTFAGMGGAPATAGHASSTGGDESSAGASSGGAGLSGAGGSVGSAGAGDGGADDRAGDDLALLEEARADYPGWVKRSDAPEAISSEIFGLCRLPTQAEQDFVASEHGGELYLLDWLNPSAEAGFAANGATPFAVGAAIVKEKLVRTGEGTYELHALGLMIKREAGFDPSHGDWQFGYWNAADGMGAGAAENAHCGDCHAGAGTDFVFMDNQWRLE